MRPSRFAYERLHSPTTPTLSHHESEAPPRVADVSIPQPLKLAPPKAPADPFTSMPNPHPLTYTRSMSDRVQKKLSRMMEATEQAIARDKHHEDKAAKRDAHHEAKAQAKAEAEAKQALRADRRVHDREEEKHRHEEKKIDREQRKMDKQAQKARKEAASKRRRQMGGISWGWDPSLEHQEGIEVGGRGREVEFPSQVLPSHQGPRRQRSKSQELQQQPTDTVAEASHAQDL